MSAERRLRQARATLAAGVLIAAALWGIAAAALALAAMRLAAPGAGIARLALALTAGAAVTGAALWRGRHVRSVPRVALWVEERVPALRYELVTLAEAPRAHGAAQLERTVAATSWSGAIRGALLRGIARPAIAAIVALSLLLLPARAEPIASGTAASSRAGGARIVESARRLRALRVEVSPPAYSGLPKRMLEDPSDIAALAGSGVVVSGPGDARGLAAREGERSIAVTERGGGWRLTTVMPAGPVALRIRDGGEERILLLEPRADSVPAVVLTAPARDTVVRAPSGSVSLVATARDDFGLGGAWLEWIVSSGEGESFSFRSGTIARRALGGARSAELRAWLELDSLGLEPGDLVHLRAVARDGNSVSGPGTGYSDTRTIRVAREGEYDSLAIEAAPPPENDKAEVSQRMLIILAESLERRRPRLARPVVVGESRRIAADQTRLRKRVGDIVFARLGGESGMEHAHEGEAPDEHAAHDKPVDPDALLRAAEAATSHDASEVLDFEGDETPVVAINRPLLEAYNAMWDAGRELEVGEPGRALPHMRRALAAIQRARAAERIYLRGRPPAVIVDLAKVRMAGTVDSTPARARLPREALRTTNAARAARLEGALAALSRDPAAGVDSLLLLRLEAIGQPHPSSGALAFARVLGEAIEALRAGRDATEPLARARRVVAMEPVPSATLPRWGGAW